MNYQVSVNMTNAAKRVFEGLDVPSSSITSLASFREIVQKMNKACIASRERMEEERADMLKTYSQGIVSEKLAELRNQYDSRVSTIRSNLSANLDKILEAKKNAIAAYTTTPPSDEQMKLLQALSMRGENSVTNAEWAMICQKCGDNFQALAIAQNFAKKQNMPFAMPFSPEDDLKKVQAIRERFETVITNIDKEPSTYNAIELLNYGQEQHSLTTVLINELDASRSSATPISCIDQLKEARNHALHVGQYDLFNEISTFIVENMNELKKAVPADPVRDSANQLIKAGMSATESKPSYEEKRDAFIKKVDAVLQEEGKE